jgi:DNA-binding transcriptional LysR family regulator
MRAILLRHLPPVNPPRDIVAIQIVDIGRLDLNLLRVMDAMFKTRKVTEAGVKLNLSQPAMSEALRKLRQTFDDPMFVRTAHGMQPTPLALEMADGVREILVRAEALHRATFESSAAIVLPEAPVLTKRRIAANSFVVQTAP